MMETPKGDEPAAEEKVAVDVPAQLAAEPEVDAEVPSLGDQGGSPPEPSSNTRGIVARFQGDQGRRLLKRQLLENHLVRGSEPVADALMGVLRLQEVQPGDIVVEQGGSDNDLYLILSGALSARTNGREVAVRVTGSHFGEMALVDSAARRAATVVATEYSVIAKISEADFEVIAEENPQLWRRLAVEISRRLHERGRLLRPPREKPAVFIGCSTESLRIAEAIQLCLQHDNLVVEIWTDGVFRPSSTAIEDLTRKVREIDFGVMVVTPDDQSEVRGEKAFSPRDNVVFELGLLIGALGRDRVMLVQPRGEEIRIPSDLSGVNPVTYSNDSSVDLRIRLAPVCTEMRAVFSRLGSI